MVISDHYPVRMRSPRGGKSTWTWIAAWFIITPNWKPSKGLLSQWNGEKDIFVEWNSENGIQTMEDSFHGKEHTAASDATGWISEIQCCVKKARHKRVSPLAFHLYNKIQKQAQLNLWWQKSGWQSPLGIHEAVGGSFWGDGEVLCLDLGGGYLCVLICEICQAEQLRFARFRNQTNREQLETSLRFLSWIPRATFKLRVSLVISEPECWHESSIYTRFCAVPRGQGHKVHYQWARDPRATHLCHQGRTLVFVP